MYFGRFMFSWTILYQLKRGYLYNALQKTNIQHSRIPHGYFKCHPIQLSNCNKFIFSNPNSPKKLTANKDVETKTQALVTFRWATYLRWDLWLQHFQRCRRCPSRHRDFMVSILWTWRTERTETPNRNGVVEHGETGLRKGGGFGTRGSLNGTHSFLGGGIKVDAHAWWFGAISLIVQCLGWCHIMSPQVCFHGGLWCVCVYTFSRCKGCVCETGTSDKSWRSSSCQKMGTYQKKLNDFLKTPST